MEGFKKLAKGIKAFKEGGSVYQSRKADKESDSADIAQDKKIVKKAIAMHDKQEHKGEKTDLSKLKKGGRAKKDCGTVRKYKTGGSVDNEYSAKKSSGDLDRIAKVKDIKPGKAAASSRASVKPNFEGSDVEKEKSKPAGHKDPYIKSKQSGKAAAAPSGAKGPDAFKCGGGVKKYAMGGDVSANQGAISDMEKRRAMEKMARAKKYLGPAQQSELINQSPAAAGLTPPTPAPATPPAPAINAGAGAPAGGAQNPAVPGGMKKGGKAKKKC
jgi:hypothetical protein